MPTDISVTINPPPTISATIGQGVAAHGFTHSPSGSDSLAVWYASNENLQYVSGLIGAPAGVVLLTGNQTISGTKNFVSRPTVNGTGVLLSGEVQGINTGQLTGAFYPLTSNPSGYVQGAVVRPSNTGNFADLQSTQTFSGAKNFTIRPTFSGVGFATTGELLNTGFLTGYVNKTETGNFASQPYVTGVSGHLQSQMVTGISITGNSTKTITLFLNNGGVITGSFVDASGSASGGGSGENWYIWSGSFNTGNGQITLNRSGDNGAVTFSIDGRYVTGSVVRPSETGAFLTTGAGDFRYTLKTETGAFTGDFYPRNSNPNGYLVSSDLSPYITIVAATGISGHLQTQINTLNGQTGTYVTGSVVRPSETGAFLTTGAADTRYINATGDQIEYLDYNTGASITWKEGRTFYDLDAHTLCYYNDVADVTLNIGQEQVVRVSNGWTGTIPNGSVVLISGAQGNRPAIIPASAVPSSITGSNVLGIATHDISSQGYVTVNGIVNGLNTIGFSEGDALFLSETSGQFTKVPPSPPSHRIRVGTVTRSHATQGAIYVHIDEGSNLALAHDVSLSGLQNGDILRYVQASGFWTNQPLNTGIFITTESATGISGHLQGQITALNNQTGNYVTTGSTGAFATNANLNSVSGIAATGFDRSITGITVTGTDTKFINLLRQDGTLLSASFVDQQGGAGSTGELTGAFYPLNSNPSGYATTGYVTGASGHLQNQIASLTGQTGSFLTTGEADNRYFRQPTVREIYVDAGAMLTGVSGATPSTISVSNSGIAYDTYLFDPAVSGFAQFKLRLADYNLGQMRAKFYWTTSGASGSAIWGLQSQAVNDGESLNGAWSTGVEISDTFITGTGFHETAAITFTPTGALQTGEMLFFRVYRNSFSTGDTLATNANLLGISIQYTGTSIPAW